MQSVLRNAARVAGISGGGAAISARVVNEVTAHRAPQPSHRPVVWRLIDPPGERRMRPSADNEAGGPLGDTYTASWGSEIFRIRRLRRKGALSAPRNPAESAEFSGISANSPIGMSGMVENDVRASAAIGHFKRRKQAFRPPIFPRNLPKKSKSGGIAQRASGESEPCPMRNRQQIS